MALWKDGWKALGKKGEGGCGRGEWRLIAAMRSSAMAHNPIPNLCFTVAHQVTAELVVCS
ncbi:hypothetical protein EYF80_012820 [Liparis tanakae]|uniref:Uncharacterized protein n=1 Tax=Liparis tanakae TaxID=230148 RepID=A0A4Z2IHN9_9TELE|nr:hypothetical protein EYF80_012820 [Liparis tanakae]